MTTFLDLQTRVKTRLIDLPSAVTGEVNTLINEALKTLETKHNFQVMKTITTINTVVGQRFLALGLPTNFKEFRPMKPYFITNVGVQRTLYWAGDQTGANKIWTQQDTGEPRVLNVAQAADDGSASIQVWPLPDGGSDYADGEYRVNVPYFRYLPDLSANSDTNWFVNNATEFLIYQAVANGFALDWDIQNSAIWEAKANNKLNEIMLRDKRLQMSQIESLVPHLGAAEPNISY